MALSKKITEALNKQFNEELNSAYLYNSMAADFFAKSQSGFGVWMTKQAGEEREHAEKIHHYLDEQGERVYYAAIPEPKASWANPIEAMKDALKHEQYITKSIHDLVYLAREEKDLATEAFLTWYVNEQVEEESSVQSIIDKLEMVGDNKLGLYQLDKEISTRQ